jgi:hypothetical protein
MIRVEVLVNSKPACMPDGYLTFLNLLVHSGRYTGHTNHLTVTGFVDGPSDIAPKLRAAFQEKTDDQQVKWLERTIEVGDEITIRLVDAPVNPADLPPPLSPNRN